MRRQANDNSYLFPREVETVDEVVNRQPDLDLTYNRVFALRQLADPTAEVHKYRVADDDQGAAELLRKLAKYPKIKISGTEATTNIYKVGISFEIPLEDVETSRAWNRPLDTEYVERAKRAVDEKVNKLAYRGDEVFGVPGVLELGGITSHSGSDFDTASLNLADQITKAVNAIPVRFRGRPYSLVMADAEFKKLNLIGNTTTNQTWIEIVKKQNPNLNLFVEAELDAGGTLSDGSTIGSGTALLVPSDFTLVRMPVGFLPEAVFSPDQNVAFNEKIEGKVKSRVGTVEAPFSASLVKITGWNN